jgi:hypothetical protein
MQKNVNIEFHHRDSKNKSILIRRGVSEIAKTQNAPASKLSIPGSHPVPSRVDTKFTYRKTESASISTSNLQPLTVLTLEEATHDERKSEMKKIYTAVIFVATGSYGFSQDHYEWQEKLNRLDKECEEARAAKLAPIRARLASECASSQRRFMSLKECEIETSTYGNNSTGARGAVAIGLYYDLPACQEAKAARKEWEASKIWKR